MLHLPKKRPWLILVGIYFVICLVWGTFMFLANKAGSQHVDADEVDALIQQSPASNQSANQPIN